MDLVYKHEPTLFGIAAVISVIVWLALIVGTIGIALIYVLLAFVFYLFVQSAFISALKGNGVKVTASQYPDLHKSLMDCCRRIGMEQPPEMYLLRTDFFNALATKFLGRNFIVLFTDVVDALADEPGGIDFYIGHELGHIHRKHLTWGPFLFPALVLPVLGAAYRRAQEYTCDRYGTACCTSEPQIQAALAAIAAGDTRWKTLDTQNYLAQIPETRRFWMSFHELTSDYPWLTKRMASALALFRRQEIKHPRRSFFAGVLSLFVPRIGAGGGVGGLLLVIVVIGVLAAIAIPAYEDYVERAAIMGALNDAQPVREAVARYAQDNGEWPQSLLDLGYATEAVAAGGAGYELALYEDGVIGIEIGTSVTGEPSYVVLEPGMGDAGALDWVCYGQNVQEARLPSACR